MYHPTDKYIIQQFKTFNITYLDTPLFLTNISELNLLKKMNMVFFLLNLMILMKKKSKNPFSKNKLFIYFNYKENHSKKSIILI